MTTTTTTVISTKNIWCRQSLISFQFLIEVTANQTNKQLFNNQSLLTKIRLEHTSIDLYKLKHPHIADGLHWDFLYLGYRYSVICK